MPGKVATALGVLDRIGGTVINLIDFYIVKKGRNDVRSFFTPSGAYGGWRRSSRT